jgi:hypothetical protein
VTRAGDEMSGPSYRLRSQVRTAVTVGDAPDYRLSGIVAEPYSGVRTGATYALSPSDVFQPSTVQVVLHLAVGWNLLSLPFDHAGTVLGLLADPNGPLVTGSAMVWQNQRMRYEMRIGGLLAGQGFWVMGTADAEVLVRGTRCSKPGVSVMPGWNLVGPVWDGAQLGDGLRWTGTDYATSAGGGIGEGMWYYVAP